MQDMNNVELEVNDKVIVALGNKLVNGIILSIEDENIVIQCKTRNEKGHFMTVTEKRKANDVLNIEKLKNQLNEEKVAIEEVKVIYKPTPKNLLPKIVM